MASRANLTVLLKLNDKVFISRLKRAREAANKFAQGVKNMGFNAARRGMQAFAAATAGASVAMVAGVKNALDYGSKMDDLSSRTGESAGDLAVMATAFEQAGIPATELGITLDRLTRRTEIARQGNNSYSKALKSAGLSSQALSKMSKIDRLKAFGEALSGMGNESKKTLAAMDLLDTGGGRLNALFEDMAGNVARAEDMLGGQADILNRQARNFDRVSDSMAMVGLKLRGFFLGVADELVPLLLKAADAFDKLDLTKKGQEFGNAMMGFFENVGRVPEILKSGMLLAAAEMVAAIQFGFVKVISTVVAGFGAAITGAINAAMDNPVTRFLLKAASPLGGAIPDSLRIDFDFDEALDKVSGDLGRALGVDGVQQSLMEMREQFAEDRAGMFNQAAVRFGGAAGNGGDRGAVEHFDSPMDIWKGVPLGFARRITGGGVPSSFPGLDALEALQKKDPVEREMRKANEEWKHIRSKFDMFTDKVLAEF